jgi:hypothetical protein
MVRVRLEGINTVRKRLADGSVKTYHYHRASGLRINGEPGAAEFVASYAEAEKMMRDRHVGGSLNALVRGYARVTCYDWRGHPMMGVGSGCARARLDGEACKVRLWKSHALRHCGVCWTRWKGPRL